jgi:tRNA(adenine34) deaminase
MIVSVSDAYTGWLSLPLAWQRAFEAAWASWRGGSAAVGAVLTDAEGAIVATGQNRIMGPPGGPGPLAGTAMAHAEMNALATLPVSKYSDKDDNYDGYTLYTTYEPCFMCTATLTTTYRIPKVAFAAYDPTWDGLLDALRRYPIVAAWLPGREHLGGPYGTLAYVLHMTGILRYWPGTYEAHERLTPARLALCRRVVEMGWLDQLSEAAAGVADVASALWDDLEALASSEP